MLYLFSLSILYMEHNYYVVPGQRITPDKNIPDAELTRLIQTYPICNHQLGEKKFSKNILEILVFWVYAHRISLQTENRRLPAKDVPRRRLAKMAAKMSTDAGW